MTTTFFDSISDQDFEDFNDYLFDILDETFNEELANMSKPNFIEIIADKIKAHFQTEWQDLCNETDMEEIEEYIDEFLEITMDILEPVLPKRQYIFYSTQSRRIDETILAKIAHLKTIPQPQQRTQEWYEFRHNLLTASNIYKLLGSESQKNSIIYEKCKPLVIENRQYFVNNADARQKGVIYEPISIKIYEDIYKTRVDDFGCIRHPKYACIGASPDGINVDPNSDRFGRMLEVKNIVNREINGIPKEEYWIQMQIQMETCDLEECDFLETRFKEFESSADFYQSEHLWRGVYLCFLERDGPQYEYMHPSGGHNDNQDMPIGIRTRVDKWIREVRESRPQTSIFTTHYWYLDEISCILVKRNQIWFQTVLPQILATWQTVETERQTGYEHRAAKKRVPMLNTLIGAEAGVRDENIRVVTL